jgi:hypothetical protein
MHPFVTAAADVMDVVLPDDVSCGQGGAVTPSPADRDAGIVQVVDMIVGDPIVEARTDPDAGSLMESAAGVVNMAVLDGVGA